MGEGDTQADSDTGRSTKVAHLIETYDLQSLGAELETLWTAEENRRSLRELATYFNERLLAAAVERADVQTLDGETENLYRLLTADDVSNADRTRARRQLEREGVDVESLRTEFVSYQAVRTYLKDERGAEYTADETDPCERERSNVQQLRGRVTAVTEGKLEQLRSGGHLDIGPFRTVVDVRVVCEACNSQYDVADLLEHGGCDCGDN